MRNELNGRSALWRWYICGLLLLATMLNYMDRQTLASMAVQIKTELQLDAEQYGRVEFGFGLAFAAGCLLFGVIVDRYGAFFVYPLVVLAWSAAGFATAYVEDFQQLMVCRIVLGFFEAGQWPCALATAQRLLSKEDRTLGNSILQSGASIGAIITPALVLMLRDKDVAGSWRFPFQAIGAVGIAWVVPWLLSIRPRDLALPAAKSAEPNDDQSDSGVASPPDEPEPDLGELLRRYVALVIVVVMIGWYWQYFRAWLPQLLQEQYGYSDGFTQGFTSAYYIATDVGCLLSGLAVKYYAAKGARVHTARMGVFGTCALLCLWGSVAAFLPASYLLIAVYLTIGAASLGLYPNYYGFTQEFPAKYVGKITGSLGAITWLTVAGMQWAVGATIKHTGSYTLTTALMGPLPLIALAALWLLWRDQPAKEPAQAPPVD